MMPSIGHEQTKSPVEDVQFVLDEIVRFAQMPKEGRQALDLREWLSMIPHPSGHGSLVCGKEALRRLRRLTETHLARSPHAGRLDASRFSNEFGKSISSRFLSEERPVDEQQVARALAAALRTAARECADLTHYIPCHLVGHESPVEFAVGPVTFRPRRLLLGFLSSDIESYVQSTREFLEKRWQQSGAAASEGFEDAADRHARWLAEGAKEYLQGFGWVAEITIKNCDSTVSFRRAELIVEGAINVLRVMLGEYSSDRFRIGGTQISPTQQATISRAEDGKLRVSRSRRFEGQALSEDWWPTLIGRASEERFARAGEVLRAVAEGSSHQPLCERLIDAFSWYGQAVVDLSPASRIVKYVTAVERLTVCGNDKDVTAIVVARAGALCAYGEAELLNVWRDKIKRAYGFRSDLVHGTVSPFDPRLGGATRLAEEVARYTLICALDFFNMLGLMTPKISAKMLAATYDKLVQEVEHRAALTELVVG